MYLAVADYLTFDCNTCALKPK